MIPRVLSIAGTDPTGGAGIHADIKSISAAGGYAMAVTTSLVAQNTQGVREVFAPPLEFLDSQLAAVFDDVDVDAVKIGMLGTADTTQLVHRWLIEHPVPLVVLDPVMVATSGDRLLDVAAEDALRGLADAADIITPNIPELAVLARAEPARCREEAVAQARTFAEAHDTTVIVKCGHLHSKDAGNITVGPRGILAETQAARIHSNATHGTGCSLSSALATRLAAGHPIDDALRWVTAWLHESIRHGSELEVGHGHGPVDHFHRARRLEEAASARPWASMRDLAAMGEAWDAPAGPGSTEPEWRIDPPGPWTRALGALAHEVTRAILELDFIRGLAAGTLPPEAFLFYLEQDARYLQDYARALAALAAHSPTPSETALWAHGAANCIETEAELHRGRLGGVPIATPSPITLAYTSFLGAATANDDYATGVAAVLPCYWVYAEVGLRLAEYAAPDHPYGDWLATYSDEAFLGETRRALASAERAFAEASPSARARAARAFMTATVLEKEFFDQADRAW